MVTYKIALHCEGLESRKQVKPCRKYYPDGNQAKQFLYTLLRVVQTTLKYLRTLDMVIYAVIQWRSKQDKTDISTERRCEFS